MRFNIKRQSIKIPSDISIFYSKALKILVLKINNKKKLIRLNVKILILKDKNTIVVTNKLFSNVISKNDKYRRSLIGITLSQIKQALLDLSLISHKKLKLVGVGYKVFEETKLKSIPLLQFKLGFSHSLFYKIPKEISIKTYQGTKLFVSGNDYNRVSHVTAIIRLCKIPEPYKGKGILYLNEN